MSEGQTLPAITSASSVDGDEYVYIVQDGVDRRATTQQIANLGGGTGGSIANGIVWVDYDTVADAWPDRPSVASDVKVLWMSTQSGVAAPPTAVANFDIVLIKSAS